MKTSRKKRKTNITNPPKAEIIDIAVKKYLSIWLQETQNPVIPMEMMNELLTDAFYFIEQYLVDAGFETEEDTNRVEDKI